MADAQVNEIALLREYASRLDAFKGVILGGCLAIRQKTESILNDMQRLSQQYEYSFYECRSEAAHVADKYEDIVDKYSLTRTNSVLLGSTPEDAKAKLNELSNCWEAIREKTSHIDSLAKGIQERTIAYALGIGGMAERGVEQLRKRCIILEQYKEKKA